METKTQITIEATVHQPVEQVWKLWNSADHVLNWNSASTDWHSTRADYDVRNGGKFSCTMAARDGSMSFDFGGTYNHVDENSLLEITLGDGRIMRVEFISEGESTRIVETFEAENSNPVDFQRAGWQAILNNFKAYAESRFDLPRIKFNIFIQAPAEKVYKTMIHPDHYTTWTEPFNPGSYFEGTWGKGSEILFLGPDQHGKIGGMVATIAENIPAKFISIKHLGLYLDGAKIISGEQVKSWAGAHENYFFIPKENGTLLYVELDTNEDFRAMFEGVWPKALQVLKDICESI